jgi:predicted glycoside hydrolase/deacetylase ChbG (UPF0249 family)
MKHLIVTADDYGVFPAINEGILEGVKEGKVNSVAVLSNFDGHGPYPGSVQNLQRLIAESKGRAEIGCHLTITSGKPITGDKMKFACDASGNFLSYTNMRNFKSPEELSALEEELCEQVKRLESVDGFKVKHLTNHHNSLTLFPHYFKIYMEVARKFNLPMRSTLIRPEKRQNFYLEYLNRQLSDNMNAIDRDEMQKFAGSIGDYFKTNADTLKSPQVLDSRHYGPVSLLPLVRLAEVLLVRQKRRGMDELYKSFSSGGENSLEFLLHLARPGRFSVERSRDLDYTGIDRSYFDSRAIEFKSIMGYDMGKWEGIERKGWGDL